MTRRPPGSSAGFTYIAALVMVVIVGIMASQAAEVWSTKMRREREVELLYRGTQVRDALRRWYGYKRPVTGTPGAAAQVQAQQPSPHGNLAELKGLVSGSDTAAKTHYLRPSMLVDPMTGKEWGLVKDAGGKIVGVASTSDLAPLKLANFPIDLDLDPLDFENKKKYSEWQFIYNHYLKPGPVGGGVTGLGGANSPAGNAPGNPPAKNGP